MHLALYFLSVALSAVLITACFTVRPPLLWLACLWVNVLQLAIALAERDWAWVTWEILAVAWFWWLRRRSGPRGKRALRELGEKSRARLAAVVRKARERLVPRRVLRPVPA